MAGLLYHEPEEPLDYLMDCITKAKGGAADAPYHWKMFVGYVVLSPFAALYVYFPEWCDKVKFCRPTPLFCWRVLALQCQLPAETCWCHSFPSSYHHPPAITSSSSSLFFFFFSFFSRFSTSFFLSYSKHYCSERRQLRAPERVPTGKNRLPSTTVPLPPIGSPASNGPPSELNDFEGEIDQYFFNSLSAADKARVFAAASERLRENGSAVSGELGQEEAVVQIQAQIRGNITREKYQEQMKQLEAEMQLEDSLDAIDLEDPAVQDAGLKIQSGFRGMQARKEVKKLKEDKEAIEAIDLEDPMVQDAGLKIQSGFRGMQARKEVKAMRESADGAGQTTDAPVEGGDNTTMEGGSTAPTDAAEEVAPAGEVEEGDAAAPPGEVEEDDEAAPAGEVKEGDEAAPTAE